MTAGVSKNVKIAETESAMHRTGLRRMQKMVDEMTYEVPRHRTFTQLWPRAIASIDFINALDALVGTFESIESSRQ